MFVRALQKSEGIGKHPCDESWPFVRRWGATLRLIAPVTPKWGVTAFCNSFRFGDHSETQIASSDRGTLRPSRRGKFRMRSRFLAMIFVAAFPSLAFAQVGESSSDQPSHHHKPHYVRHNHISHVSRHYHGGGGWGAIAVSLADGGASSGFAVRRGSPAAALADAVSVCSQTGRSGCYAPNAAFKTCGYVSISVEGSSYSAWGTGGTPEEAVNQCQSQGVSCGTPIGGCN
jgi:Domain of unknown function (DUF4189)